MVDLLVVAIGFTCLTPGIAIATFGTVGLQAMMPLFGFYCLFFPLSRLRLPLQTVYWVLANICGLIFSYLFAVISARGYHAEYLLFQSLLYAGAGVGFGTILLAPLHRRIFLESYVAAALISSAVGIFQAVLSATTGIVLSLTNNQNFSLTRPIGRAAAFTPEASDLAALLLPALVCVWFEQARSDSALRPLLRSQFALALLFTGLIATRSSMLIFTPLVLLAAAAFCARDWRRLVASAARTLAVVGVAGVLFLPIYLTRIDDSDARMSAAWRGLKIATGLKIFAEDPLLGTGPGYVSDPASFSRSLEIPRDLTWMVAGMGALKKGIDSTPVRLLAEGGVVGFVLAYYPIIVFWRRARTAARTAEWRPVFSLGLPLIFVQTVAVGYRDLAILMLPSILFTVAGVARVELGLRSKDRKTGDVQHRLRPDPSAVGTSYD